MICGIKSKSLALLLALLFLPLSALFSDVNLTDEEYQTIMDSLTESQTALTTSQEEMKKLRDQLNESKMELIRLQSTLTQQATELALLRTNSDLQSKSYEQLKTRVDLLWIDRVGFGLLGFGSGFGIKALIDR